MNKNEAIKTLRDYLTTGWRKGTAPESTEALAALDSLAANSKDLEPEIQTLVQENFWELAGKPAVEPSEEAREFAQKMTSGYWPNLPEMHEYMSALITARDERIRREERERCAWQVEHYVSGRIVEIDDLKAAIMGGKK